MRVQLRSLSPDFWSNLGKVSGILAGAAILSDEPALKARLEEADQLLFLCLEELAHYVHGAEGILAAMTAASESNALT